MSHLVYIALGSNQGDRRELLDTAIRHIQEEIGSVEQVSTYIETEPEGFVSVYLFLNAVLRLKTELTPEELLDKLQDIERRLGRTKKSHDGLHYDRTIDLDILLYDELSIDTPRLTIPHPRMYERDFVMRPLQEVLNM